MASRYMWLESTTWPGDIQAIPEVIQLANSFVISHMPGYPQTFEKGAAVHWLLLTFKRNCFQYREQRLEGDGIVNESQKKWAEYIRRPAQGDERALASLYDASSSLVYGVALRILGEPMDAEEVTLDVYMQVWRQASRFDLGRGNPTAWLAILARSRAVDRLRVVAKRRQRESGLGNEVDRVVSKDNPERDTLLTQRRSWLARALSTLPNEQRQAIELATF